MFIRQNESGCLNFGGTMKLFKVIALNCDLLLRLVKIDSWTKCTIQHLHLCMLRVVCGYTYFNALNFQYILTMYYLVHFQKITFCENLELPFDCNKFTHPKKNSCLNRNHAQKRTQWTILGVVNSPLLCSIQETL